jgi:hypothetical protein
MKALKILLFFLLIICIFTFGKTDAEAEVVVYDADGQFLGVSDNYPMIFIPWLEKLTRVATDSGDLNYTASLYFESTDCSGQPYASSYFTQLIYMNNEKYYTGEKVAPINMEIGSLRNSKGRCYERTNTDTLSVVPAEQVPPPFALPVALPLSMKVEKPRPGQWERLDFDGDKVPNAIDNCPVISNRDQSESDGDSVGDACDYCPDDPDNIKPGICGCGLSDSDGDGICDDVDNCPRVYNPDQADSDGDGKGDVCDFPDPPYYGASLLKLNQNIFYKYLHTKFNNWLRDFSIN